MDISKNQWRSTGGWPDKRLVELLNSSLHDFTKFSITNSEIPYFFQEMPIDSVDDLARQTAIEYGTLHGGSSMEFFKNSRIDVYSKIWEFMQSRPYVMVNSTREGVEFVQEAEGRYAFLLEAGLNDYYRLDGQ